MSYTWAQFKNKVKEFLTDGSLSDTMAVSAVTEYVRAQIQKDLGGTLEQSRAHMALYREERKRLLGWSITLGTDALRTQVRAQLTDTSQADDVATRAVAEYVKAHFNRDVIRDEAGYKLHMGQFLDLKRRLVGFATTLDASTLKTNVKSLVVETTVNDTTAIQAVADFVKSRIAREVDRNTERADHYFKTYWVQRNRLFGYTVTISGSTLRTAVNKLLTVDAARLGVAESGGYIDQCIAEATDDIAGLDAFIVQQIAQAKTEITGLTAYLNAKIELARLDIAAASTQIDSFIRGGVIDCQCMIPAYRIGHQSDFESTDLALEGRASKGRLPEGAELRDAYFISVGDCIADVVITNPGVDYTYATITPASGSATFTATVDDGGVADIAVDDGGEDYATAPALTIAGDGTGAAATAILGNGSVPLVNYDWSLRKNLVAGAECLNFGQFYISFDPNAKTFYVYPHVDSNHKVTIYWDGRKIDFGDADVTPFDEAVAGAVAEYVLAQKARFVEQNMQLYNSIMDPQRGSYITKRTHCYLDARNRRRMQNG